MTDLELLYLVLVLLYGWECACWLRRGAVGFRTWLGRRWGIAYPSALLGNQRGGFVLAHPLPPLGILVTGNPLPLSFSPEAVLAGVGPTGNQGGFSVERGRLVRFQEIRAIEADGKKLRVNGELLLKTGSPYFTAFLAQQLQRLHSLAPEERPAAIARMARDTLDAGTIEHRWQDFRRQTARLQLTANFLFGYLFVLAPIVIWNVGLGPSWLVLLAGLFGLTFAAAMLFRRVHKNLYPAAADECFTHFIIVLLSPVTAIRACDLLARPLLETFHPLALAKVFCPGQTFRDFAREALLALHHPLDPVGPPPAPALREMEDNSRAVWQNAVAGFLKQNGLEPEQLLQPPPPADETCRSYCPRCLSQFTTSTGVCEDCGGLPLVPFAASPLEGKRL